jgi:hypothetical protein
MARTKGGAKELSDRTTLDDQPLTPVVCMPVATSIGIGPSLPRWSRAGATFVA